MRLISPRARDGEADQEFARFLDMAHGSVAETHSHVMLACDLGFMKPQVAERLSEKVVEIRRMLTGLNDTLRKKGNETAGSS